MRALITARLVARLQKTESRAEVWDTRLPRFFVQVRASGHTSYFLRCKAQGRTVNRHLGNAATLTVRDARLAALRCGDAGEAGETGPRQPTLALAFETHYIPHAKASKKSWFLDVSLFRRHIQPVFGERPIDTLTPAEITAWHQALRRDHGLSAATCNQALFVLRRFYKLALEAWQLPGLCENPARAVANFRLNNQRQIYLKPDEIDRLLGCADRLRNPLIAPILRFLLLTGVRLQNALQARWQAFDLDAQVWHVPQTKSGKPQDIWLSTAAVALLRELPSRGVSPWLFPQRKTGLPLRNLHTTWYRLREQADLPGVRLHDLRHTFASIMIQQGYSLYVVQNALGHQSPNMTLRYAHLANTQLKEAVNAVGRVLQPGVDGQA